MLIIYNDNNTIVRAAVDFVNDESFLLHLRNRLESRTTRFYNTLLDTEVIVARLLACTTAVKVEHWTPVPPPPPAKDPYRNTTAITSTGAPFVIKLNTNLLPHRKEKQVVNTLLHEFVHNVDYHWDGDRRADYTHEGPYPDDPPENQDSAPYWIGNEGEAVWEQVHQQPGHEQFVVAKRYAEEWGFECLVTGPR
jgi:SprT-like family